MDTEWQSEEVAIEFFLTAFQPYINEHVVAEDLMVYYTLYTSEQRKRIRRLTREKPNEAVQTAFDIIADEIIHPHKYKHLQEALKEADYPKIVTILIGRSVPINKRNKQHIQKLTPMILGRLKVGDILPHLRAKFVLQDRDVLEIQATLTQKGDWYAGLDLLIMVTKRNTNWYQRFIQALMDSGHVDLAYKIDGELCEKIKSQTVSGDAEDIEPLDGDFSVMPVSLVGENTDATTDNYTSMMEIPVVDPADDTPNTVLENVIYERYTTPEPSMNNLDAPPPQRMSIRSQRDSFEQEISSLTRVLDINKDTAMQSKGEPAPAQPKQCQYSKPKNMVPQLGRAGQQEVQLLQKRAQMPEMEAQRQAMRENSPGPVTNDIRDKDIGRVNMHKKKFTQSATQRRRPQYKRHDQWTLSSSVSSRQNSLKTSANSEIRVQSAVIKGFHKYKITLPKTKPPIRLHTRVDSEYTNVRKNIYGFDIFVPCLEACQDTLHHDTIPIKQQVELMDIAGAVVGHPPVGFTYTFHCLFGMNCSIFAEVTGAPVESFPPWPLMQMKGGGWVIPCNYIISCHSDQKEEVFKMLWSCLENMREGKAMSLQPD